MEAEIKKLTSKDLMIGDWVLVDKNSWITDEYNPNCGVVDYQPYQIKSGEDIDDTDVSDSPTLPIPITEDILEKNFKGNGYGCYDIFRNDDIGECLYYHNGFHTICYKPDKDSWSCNMRDEEIKYVHELQHFLKGIKLDKEIIV